VKPEEEKEMLEISDPIVEGILHGFNECDYSEYSKNFSDVMLKAQNKAKFEETREFIFSKTGKYMSRGDPQVVAQGPYVIVVYNAKFREEPEVFVKVVFSVDDPEHKVMGLWFDSKKLRESL
jgi:hypothetical protein